MGKWENPSSVKASALAGYDLSEGGLALTGETAMKNALRAWNLGLLLTVCFLGIGPGCGGGGGSISQPGDGGGTSPPSPTHPPEASRLAEPEANLVSGRVVLPDSAPIDVADLRVLSVMDEAPVFADGSVTSEIVAEGESQLVLLTDEAGGVIMPAYLERGASNVGFILDAVSMAKGMIALNPYLMILPARDREQFVVWATEHVLFGQLVQRIEGALLQDPKRAADFDANPEIFQTAMRIGGELLAAYGHNASDSSKLLRIGDEGKPHLDDGPNGYVRVVNPEMCFYGVAIRGPVNHDLLIAGKDSLVSVQWALPPSLAWTEPEEELVNLGDGTFQVDFYKGFNGSIAGWLDPRTAQGMATYANFLKAVVILLDTVASCPLSNDSIKKLVELVSSPTFEELRESLLRLKLDVDGSRERSWLDWLDDAVTILREHWDDISYWVWQAWPGVKTADFMSGVGALFEGVQKAIPLLNIISTTASLANTAIPFYYDLVFATGHLSYCMRQEDGALSLTCADLPPLVTFAWSPTAVVQGDAVVFDAGDSIDPDDFGSLTFSWDFDGDGIYEVNDRASPTVVHTFDASGTTKVVLVAEDADGNKAQLVQWIPVERRNAPPPTQVPDAPTHLGATASVGQATITWTNVSGADTYNLYYGTSSPVTRTNGTQVTGVTSPRTVSGLAGGITHYFRVTAVNEAGESALSAQVSSTPSGTSLLVTSYNVNSSSCGVSGASVKLYYEDWTYKSTRTTNGSGAATWAGLGAGTYNYKVYKTNATSGLPTFTEYWGAKSVTVSTGQTTSNSFTRFEPYATTFVVRNATTHALIPAGSTIPAGTQVYVQVLVQNDGGSARTSKVRVILDRSRSSGYDLDRTSTAAGVGANGGTYNVTLLPFIPPSSGSYYAALVVTTLINGSYTVTDSWSWSPTPAFVR